MDNIRTTTDIDETLKVKKLKAMDTEIELMKAQTEELKIKTSCFKALKNSIITALVGLLVALSFGCVMAYWIYDIIFQYIDYLM